MKFGELSVDEAEGAIVAHSQKVGSHKLNKGCTLTASDIAELRAIGIESIMVAQIEPEDVCEDEAAETVADAVRGPNVRLSSSFTGRVNLYAEKKGLVIFDRAILDRINLVDESITIATVSPYELVKENQVIATIKIIPFAVPRANLKVISEMTDNLPNRKYLIQVSPLTMQRIGLIQTRLPGTKESVLDKTSKVTALRIKDLGSQVLEETRCKHQVTDVASALNDLRTQGTDFILIAGATAITDRRDVIPAAILEVGGIIDHFGMPVDPGNLLLLGRIDNMPVIGLPGCARSPKFNGFDWILQRLVARIPLKSTDIMKMGAGGLLTDIPTRPLPRADIDKKVKCTRDAKIAAIVLAAGQSRRMGDKNKLLAEIDGQPMITQVVDAALSSKVTTVYVIIGYEANKVRQALSERNVNFVHNQEFEAGLSASLKRGITALPDEIDGAIICLGDMPRITKTEIDRLIDVFSPLDGHSICIPTYEGRRGNPVLWSRKYFREIQKIKGDIGARNLLDNHDSFVTEVEMSNESILLDIDTPGALANAKL